MTKVSEYEVLRIKAIEHFQMAEKAINTPSGEEPLYEQAIMNCHLGLEMVIKTVLLKNGVRPNKTHNLSELCSQKVRNRKILHAAINSSSAIRPIWGKVVDVWDANKRYEFMGLEPDEYDDLYDCYRRIYGWIKSQFNI